MNHSHDEEDDEDEYEDYDEEEEEEEEEERLPNKPRAPNCEWHNNKVRVSWTDPKRSNSNYYKLYMKASEGLQNNLENDFYYSELIGFEQEEIQFI